MADWSKPTLTSTYTNFLTELSTRIDDAGKLSRSDTVTLTNPPVGTIRWNTTSAKWQTNTGTVAVPVWSDLAATYGISISGNAATATSATSATSATTATTATNQSGGTVSATTLAASGAVTLSGGTANGVPYLNGSKVLTSGAALVFDGANLGVGVTPSAWAAISASMQLADYGNITSKGTRLWIGTNYYYAVGEKYVGTGLATRYRQSDGAHLWDTAPSGTAGNAITFTQAMTLDASGNLGVGTAAPSGADGKAFVVYNGSGAARLALKNNATGDAAGDGFQIAVSGSEVYLEQREVASMVFTTSNSEAMRLNSAGNLIAATAVTGYWQIPRGTTAQRPTGASGMIRFNSTVNKYEGYNGTAWANIGGGATGGGTDDVFVENGQTVNTNYTITTGKNAMSAGPITIASGITVTVPSGSTWVVV